MAKRRIPHITTGDHIKVWRPTQGGYFHHGIYCDNETVIHYSGEIPYKIRASIRQDTLNTFADNGKIEIVKYKHCLPPYYTIKRAKGRIGEREYNLFFNNCEHFAKWCKTGASKSHQVDTVLYFASKILLRNPIFYLVAEGVYILWDHYLQPENPQDPEYLPPDILLLFQMFREAYEHKNIQGIANTISQEFEGSRYYGTSKDAFIQTMQRVFQSFKYGAKPSLKITIYDILSESSSEFQAVIDMIAHANILGTVPLPFTQYDSAKLLCTAKPEGSDWKISRIERFTK